MSELNKMLVGKNNVEIFPVDTSRAAVNAGRFQADESSNFGLLILQSGGVSAAGAVRLLGSTQDPELRDINAFNAEFGGEGFIILGDDVFGGVFALNAGLIPDCMGNILYFAPNTLEWEDLETKLSGLFAFLANGDIRGFYGHLPDETFTRCLEMNTGFNQALSFYPPQWSREFKSGVPDIRVIDVREHYRLLFNGGKQCFLYR